MNTRNTRNFNNFHPFAMLLFYLCVIVLSIILANPFYSGVSFFCAMIFALLCNKTVIKFCCRVCLPLIVLSMFFNPIFNHRGATVLFYLFDNAITLESIIYGINSGIMLSAVLLWFYSLNFFMTADKYHYIFSKNLPKTGLIFSMSMGLIPKMQRQLKEISEARTMIGKGTNNGFLNKIRFGTKNLFALLGWSFENGLDTADSISARGFGIKNRTSYHRFKIKFFDIIMLASSVLLIVILILTMTLSSLANQFFPILDFSFSDFYNIILLCVFSFTCVAPIFIELFMRLKWHISISKI